MTKILFDSEGVDLIQLLRGKEGALNILQTSTDIPSYSVHFSELSSLRLPKLLTLSELVPTGGHIIILSSFILPFILSVSWGVVS